MLFFPLLFITIINEVNINNILYILDYKKELPLSPQENDEDIDIREAVLQDVYKKEMRIKKSCM